MKRMPLIFFGFGDPDPEPPADEEEGPPAEKPPATKLGLIGVEW